MSFTDADLKRMKEDPETYFFAVKNPERTMKTLLARLEAAERLIQEWIILDETLRDDKYVKDWLKSKGEGK